MGGWGESEYNLVHLFRKFPRTYGGTRLRGCTIFVGSIKFDQGHRSLAHDGLYCKGLCKFIPQVPIGQEYKNPNTV